MFANNGITESNGFAAFFNATSYAFRAYWTTSGNVDWATDTTPSADTWEPFGLSYDGSSTSNDAIVWQAGVKKIVGAGLTRSTAPAGSISSTNALYIGNRQDDLRNWDGIICELAFWNVVLNDVEFSALAGRTPPYLIRPQSIIGYYPFHGPFHPALDLGPMKRTNRIGSFSTTGTKLQADPIISKNRTGVNSKASVTSINFPLPFLSGPAPLTIGYTNSPMGHIRRMPIVIGY